METLANQQASACCSSCEPADATSELAIACALGSGDFKQRTFEIRALAARSLRRARREPLRLELTYDVEAFEDVRDLIAKESECCAFLSFDLKHDDREVSLAVTAPASALAVAGELFAHFAPELARESV